MPSLASPAATFMRFPGGSLGTGTPTRRHVRPSSALFQISAAPAVVPWLGCDQIRADNSPLGSLVKAGQAQTLSMAMIRS